VALHSLREAAAILDDFSVALLQPPHRAA
jgi:hypothetical protein